MDLPVGLSTGDAATMWLVLAPLTIFVTAAQLLVALFARTYKEAQTQLSLLMFLPMIPGFFFAFGSMAVKPWMEWTPVLAQHVMLSAVLRGESPSPASLMAMALVTLAAGGLVATTTSKLLSHESITR
jgi:sodium transport system permease protein